MIDRAAYQLGTLTDPDREMIRRSWVWFVSLGAALTAIGVVGFVATGVLSLATAILIGWLLAVGGLLTVIHAVVSRGWSGFLYDLLNGAVTALIGGLIVARPVAGLAVMTGGIGVMFLLGGILWLALALTRSMSNSSNCRFRRRVSPAASGPSRTPSGCSSRARRRTEGSPAPANSTRISAGGQRNWARNWRTPRAKISPPSPAMAATDGHTSASDAPFSKIAKLAF